MSPPGLLSPNAQLRALLRLRWQMIRSTPLRWGILVLTFLPATLVLVGLFGVQTAPEGQRLNLALATPSFYVGFIVLALLAPLVSGGGYELYPADQLVAYPVRPATVFRSTLVLAPVNLAWMINVVALFVVTGYAAGDLAWGPTARALVVVAAFIGLATVVGHAAGWLVMGVRQNRLGRWVTNIAGIAVLFAGLLVFWTDNVITLLDRSPTARVLRASFDGYEGYYEGWLRVLAALVIPALVLVKVGDAVTGWALRRSGDHQDRSSARSFTRRRQHSHRLLALVAVDHASVWRSTPLRRGVLVLVLVPGVVAALAGMTWQSLVLVPGLIAAGAGLLFGINSFTLDSSGSVWLATLPGWPQPSYLSKSLVFLEISLAAVLSALIGGSLRAPAPASGAEVVAAAASAVSCALIVVAIGMRSSLRHPYRAVLQGPRDTPATPGVMAAQSIRFATITTFTSLYFVGLALAGPWWFPLLGALPVILLAILHWYRTSLAWRHPYVRANVVLSVSGG
jgi:hypothetical protein